MIIQNIDFKQVWITILEHHKGELHKYTLTEETLPQIMTSIAALSVFPFAARGIFEVIFGKMGVDFDNYLEARKEFAAEFVIKAITR